MTDALSALQSVLGELATTRESYQSLVDKGNQQMADAQAQFAAGQALVNIHSPRVEAFQAAMDHITGQIAKIQATPEPIVGEAPPAPEVASPVELAPITEEAPPMAPESPLGDSSAPSEPL